jgi:5-methylcytosine-specific restriction endonuclease McrA
MSKRNRVEDPKLCEQVRRMNCEACGSRPPSEVHHIITRARLGPDFAWNLMPLCTKHHRLWHDKPLSEFLEQFPHMHTKLFERGFLWEPTFKKLIPDWTKVSLA